MPELPEVETTRRALAPHVAGRRIAAVRVRRRDLREPVPRGLGRRLAGARVTGLDRRGKHLLLRTDRGTLILHLGMSGSLRLVPAGTPAGPHEHLDLVLDDGRAVRLRDPRRFGLVLWTAGDPLAHPRLAGLGPEPFDRGLTGARLRARLAGRRAPVRNLLLDGRLLAGIGNIYANEALFLAGIHPACPGGALDRAACTRLLRALRRVLRESLRAGGTTLRDYVDGTGDPGRYALRLRVYGRAGAPCPRCGAAIRRIVVGQRSAFCCPRCQRCPRRPRARGSARGGRARRQSGSTRNVTGP